MNSTMKYNISLQCKEISIKINTTNNTINKAKWKSVRNKILEIRKLCKKAYEKCLKNQLQLMEKSRDDKQTFQAMKFQINYFLMIKRINKSLAKLRLK